MIKKTVFQTKATWVYLYIFFLSFLFFLFFSSFLVCGCWRGRRGVILHYSLGVVDHIYVSSFYSEIFSLQV